MSSKQVYPGHDGVTVNYTVTFGFLAKEHIRVEVNGAAVSFTWRGPTALELVVRPVAGDTLVIRRETPRAPLIAFALGSTLSKGDLDLLAKQAVFLAEEALEAQIVSLSYDDALEALTAAGLRLSNLADPVGDTDAANKQWVEALWASALADIQADILAAAASAGLALTAQEGAEEAAEVAQSSKDAYFASRLQDAGAVRLTHGCGQSNMVGVYPTDASSNEPPDRAPAAVKVWDPVAAAWVGSSWKGLPWTRTAPHGSGLVTGCPNIGLSFAIRMQEAYGGSHYHTHNARSGRSIEDWVGAGAASSLYVEDKAKIEAALATPELDGVEYVAAIIRAQSEEDYNRVFGVGDTFPLGTVADFLNNGEVYRTYLACLELYLAQLKAEAWWGPSSVLILIGNSNLHRRYMPIRAMRDFSQRHPEVIFVSAEGMTTRTDLSDFTHFDGPSIDTIGYRMAFAGYERRWEAGDIAPSPAGFMSNRVGEPYRRGDDTIVFPTDAVLDASFKKVASKRGTTKTLVGGVITVDGSYHAVDTEGGAASDDLDTINGGVDGMTLVLRCASNARDVVLQNNTGNISLGAATRTLSTTKSRIALHYDAVVGFWSELSFSTN